MLKKENKIYEGKAKILYSTNKPGLLIQYFKNDATAFNGKKKDTIRNKGKYNNKISSMIFDFLLNCGVNNHFVEYIDDCNMLIKNLDMIAIEIVIRNIVAGSLAKRLGLEQGENLKFPIIEFYYKNDSLNDPMINEDHIISCNIASQTEVDTMKNIAKKVNMYLKTWLEKMCITLVDMKLEFGRFENNILLGDEISPDTCRFWDSRTQEKLDKDRFRFDLGNIESSYQEIYKRISEYPIQ